MSTTTPPTAHSTKLGLVTIPGADRPAGYTYLEAWEETAERICVAFQLAGWTEPEFDFFASWADAHAVHPALAS